MRHNEQIIMPSQEEINRTIDIIMTKGLNTVHSQKQSRTSHHGASGTCRNVKTRQHENAKILGWYETTDWDCTSHAE